VEVGLYILPTIFFFYESIRLILPTILFLLLACMIVMLIGSAKSDRPKYHE